MFFDDWTRLGEIALASLMVFVFLVVALRLSGKRTTSKMNSFDWVVTVAMGSMVGMIILNVDITLADGAIGLGALVLIQHFSAWLASRSAAFQNTIEASPSLLFYDGHFYTDVMRRERVSKKEIRAAIRSQGITHLRDVAAVILENNADLSILPNCDHDSLTDLLDEVKPDPH